MQPIVVIIIVVVWARERLQENEIKKESTSYKKNQVISVFFL